MSKVVVIGGGFAGAAAALAAREAGAEATIIGFRPGATSFCSGGLDLCGDPAAAPETLELLCRDTARNIGDLVKRKPGHPYAAVSGGTHGEAAEDVLALFDKTLAALFPDDGEYALAGDSRVNTPCLTSLGTAKFSARFPSSTATLEAEGMERPLALGVAGFLDFEPQTWSKVAGDMGSRLGRGIGPLSAMIGFGGGRDIQSPELAALIAADPEGFVEAAAKAAAGSGASALVLPPILPGPGRAGIIWKLGETCSMPVYETLSLPPSQPGLRLMEHIGRTVLAAGVEVVAGHVVGHKSDNGRIESVAVKNGGGETAVSGDAFVLAAGKYLSGGLDKGDSFAETVFGLPVFCGDAAPSRLHIEKALGKRVSDSHPMLSMGVSFDSSLRPLSRDGVPRFENLFGAGSVLAGHDYVRDGTGAGVALVTGARAGAAAAG